MIDVNQSPGTCNFEINHISQTAVLIHREGYILPLSLRIGQYQFRIRPAVYLQLYRTIGPDSHCDRFQDCA
ncbi:hypothetical protein D3C75_720970 [compost metagenome]